jgi:L-cystine uptake protein TcyP (sodium:dicarboxylate symporter family)
MHWASSDNVRSPTIAVRLSLESFFCVEHKRVAFLYFVIHLVEIMLKPKNPISYLFHMDDVWPILSLAH